MDSIQIARLLQSKPQFLGVFPANLLPSPILFEPYCFIANTDPSGKPGNHWVAFYVEGNVCDYFDSMGLPPTHNIYFLNFLQNFPKYRWNNSRIQGSATTCGQYTVLFIIARINGYSMDDFVELFSAHTLSNDIVTGGFVNNMTVEEIPIYDLKFIENQNNLCVDN
jgi:hypothetical protein